MLSSLFIFFMTFVWQCRALLPTQINATFNTPVTLQIDKTVDYIIGFSGVESAFPPVVQLSSEDAVATAPLMVVVRQPREVLSWQLPLIVESENGGVSFNDTSRTLCGVNQVTNGTLIQDNPIVSLSTASRTNITFTVEVTYEREFYINLMQMYEIEISPSKPRYYYYNFVTNLTENEARGNMDTVILEVNSNNTVCMTVSIQNASCPVFDLNHDITYTGFYETVSTKGGITIPKNRFPYGFYLVFVAKSDDSDCTGSSHFSQESRIKTLSFVIKLSISYSDYLNAVFATLGSILLFYVVFGLSFFFCSIRGYVPRSMEYVSDINDATTPSIATVPDLSDNLSFDETEYDTIAEASCDREFYLNKPVIYLSDLARKDPRILKRKSYLYLYNVLTVALFYGLPVVQLVTTYQKVLNNTGQQDLCYYNFLCAHPLGFLSDFNHLFSNVGYVAFGFLFLWIAYRREVSHKDLNFDRQYGIPQHYGMFYAMGVALIMEGVLSGSYHICPNHFNFQFDSSFMYVIAVLCMVKLYQNRHPDINATAYATFGVLAIAILLGMIGIMEANIFFWIFFTVIHIIVCLYLTAQIYYMGCWKFDTGLFIRVYRICAYDFWAGPLNLLKPLHKGRMVLLVIGNVCNWLLAYYGIYHQQKDFAMYLLAVFMSNTLLYFIFYVFMKLLHKERINRLSTLFLLLSVLCAISAMWFFLRRSISWSSTPAQSRQFNQECKLLNFYDYHDIWHFLSAVGMFFTFMMLLTLDDDLSHTHRCKIHVF